MNHQFNNGGHTSWRLPFFARKTENVPATRQKYISKPWWKRPLDLALSLTSMPLVLPVVLLLVIWIKLVSRGPVLFRQERIGRYGIPFNLFKLRTMRHNVETKDHEAYLRHLAQTNGPMIKLDFLSDARMIQGGRLIRASGLDEIPQLLNVLRGEMSIVGPRPCLPHEYPLFRGNYMERFEILPGLTGRWQVSQREQTTFTAMNRMDIDYARQPSISEDLRIILKTPSFLAAQFIKALRHTGQRISIQRTPTKDRASYTTN